MMEEKGWWLRRNERDEILL